MPATPKTKLPTAVSRKREYEPQQNGNYDETQKTKKRFVARPKKTIGWQKHTESIKGFYFPLTENWYVFVCTFKNEIRIHIREYFKVPDGTLVPTKTGATLWEEDFNTLKKICSKARETWRASDGEILNHALSTRSDYYLIIGPDENGDLKFCIKICFASGDGESLTSTTNGANLDLDGWNKLVEQITEISDSIEKMRKYIMIE